MEKTMREFIDSLPPFTDDPVDRVNHVLAVFADSPDDEWVVAATYNAIPGHQETGFTWADLRSVMQRVNGTDQ